MKSRKLSIRISDEDLKVIHHKAEKSKLSITDYVTKCCLDKQIFVIKDLDEVIRQQKALGRNLNQLTTLCNMGKVSFANLEKLTTEYAELNRTMSKLLQRRRWSA